jgi:hypothetical protein
MKTKKVFDQIRTSLVKLQTIRKSLEVSPNNFILMELIGVLSKINESKVPSCAIRWKVTVGTNPFLYRSLEKTVDKLRIQHHLSSISKNLGVISREEKMFSINLSPHFLLFSVITVWRRDTGRK